MKPGAPYGKVFYLGLRRVPEIGLIADVALDEYSSDGQDGLVKDGEILNDETIEVMVKSALVQAAAGADMLRVDVLRAIASGFGKPAELADVVLKTVDDGIGGR